jgi:anti-anti-sigma factor
VKATVGHVDHRWRLLVNNHDPQSCFLLPWPVINEPTASEALEIEGRFVGLRSGDVWIVRAVGAIDASTSDKLRKTIDGMCDADMLSMIVNVEDVGHIDTAGLDVFASAWRRLRSKGRSLAVVGPTPSVQRALRAAGFERAIRSYATDEQALSEVNSESPNPGEPLPEPKPDDEPSPAPHPHPPVKKLKRWSRAFD